MIINHRYPVAIEKGNENTTFGVVVPDLPGCFSVGENLEQALLNAKVAISLHLHTLLRDGSPLPTASAIEDHHHKPEYQGWMWTWLKPQT